MYSHLTSMCITKRSKTAPRTLCWRNYSWPRCDISFNFTQHPSRHHFWNFVRGLRHQFWNFVRGLGHHFEIFVPPSYPWAYHLIHESKDCDIYMFRNIEVMFPEGVPLEHITLKICPDPRDISFNFVSDPKAITNFFLSYPKAITKFFLSGPWMPWGALVPVQIEWHIMVNVSWIRKT